MQAYYFDHMNDEGMTKDKLWEGAIDAGEKAINDAADADLKAGGTAADLKSKSAVY